MHRLYLILFLALSLPAFSQPRKPLTHDVYDSWKNINSTVISNDGRFVSWEVNPQQGDGWLFLYDRQKSRLDSVKRGYNAKFSPDAGFLVYQVKPAYAVTRKAKLDKKKKEDLPKDSLAVWLIQKDSILRYPCIRSYLLPQESVNNWIAIWYSYTEEKTDTAGHKQEHTKIKAPKKSKQIKDTGKLQFLNPLTGAVKTVKLALEVSASRNGEAFAYSYLENDTSEKQSASMFLPQGQIEQLIFSAATSLKKFSLDDAGRQLAFLASADTSKIKTYNLYFRERTAKSSVSLVDTATTGIRKGWAVSENGNIYFSKDGLRLFFGIARRPLPEPKDTILEEEKPSLDVWNWKDDLIQPQQKIQAENEKKSSYLALIYPKTGKLIQLTDSSLKEIILPWRGNGDFSIGLARKPYLKMASWDASNYKNIYAINLITGERKLISKKSAGQIYLSPNGKNWSGIIHPIQPGILQTCFQEYLKI